MGFVNILIAVCRGTEIFPFLVRIPLLKAFFHFLLLAFTCTVFIVAARSIPSWKMTHDACAALDREFGSFLIDKDGLLPAKDPASSRALMLSKDFLLDYQAGRGLSSQMDDDSVKAGIVWTPLFLGSWKKIKADAYVFTPIIYNIETGKLSLSVILDKAEMEAYITKISLNPETFSRSFGYSTLHDLQIKNFFNALPVFLFMILGGLFAATIFNIVFSTLVFAAIFSLVYNFMRDGTSKLSGMNIFVVTLYASFPPIMIASLFPALELPFLDFQTVHMFALLGYLFVVFNRVQQSLTPPKKNDDELDF